MGTTKRGPRKTMTLWLSYHCHGLIKHLFHNVRFSPCLFFWGGGGVGVGGGGVGGGGSVVFPFFAIAWYFVGLVKPIYRRVVFEEVVAGLEIPGGGGRGRLYLTLHCHHQNDFCIKTGSDESSFSVSITARGNAIRRCPQITSTFEDKAEPKRNRTEVLLLSSLRRNRYTRPVHKEWHTVCPHSCSLGPYSSV